MRRNVSGHYGAGGYYGPFADCYAREYCGIDADPSILADNSRCHE